MGRHTPESSMKSHVSKSNFGQTLKRKERERKSPIPLFPLPGPGDRITSHGGSAAVLLALEDLEGPEIGHDVTTCQSVAV